MKKILVLTITMFSLLACSSDDENNLDPIIGTWYKFSQNGEEFGECEKKTTFTFSENGTYSITPYVTLNNECIIDGKDDGNWSNKSEGNYGIIPSGETEEAVAKIVFSNNNNTLTFTQENTIYKRK